MRREFHFLFQAESGSCGGVYPTFIEGAGGGVSAEGLEYPWVGFAAAQAESGDDVQVDQMSAVRVDLLAVMPGIGDGADHLAVFGEAVTQAGVDLEDVEAWSHSAVADEVAGVIAGEQVLPGRH